MFQRASDNRWCEKVTVNGKQKTLTAKTKKELIQKIRDVDTFKSNGRTFEQSADLWFNDHSDDIEANTYQSYKPHVRRAKEFFSARYISDITPDEVKAYIDSLAQQNMAKDTVHRALNVLSMIFTHEITLPDSSLRYNPCAAVKLPKNLSKTRREPPTEEQIYKVTPDSEMGLFAFFLLYTGLRRGELLALRYEDLDRENKCFKVEKVIQYISNQPIVKDRPKTSAGIRTVVIPDILLNVIPNKKRGYIFGGSKPLTAMEFNRGWLEWCKTVGLAECIETKHKAKNGHEYTKHIYKPLVTAHQFRHQYASFLEEIGVSETTAMTLLGHSSITVTKDIYTHIRQRKLTDDTAKMINDYIAKKDG